MPDRLTFAVDRNVPVPMRDGIVLYADVYRPSGPGRIPRCYSGRRTIKRPIVSIALILRAVSERLCGGSAGCARPV